MPVYALHLLKMDLVRHGRLKREQRFKRYDRVDGIPLNSSGNASVAASYFHIEALQ